jgi:NAD-dependent SIR2 family protein deacetylase
MSLPEFLRQHEIRSPNIMWFLGAGASAAAGIPTAFNMIWDFKRTLYCSAQRVPISSCSDLGSPVLRAKLQQYFNAAVGFPLENSDEEYSHYFRATYPNEQDRRRYIDRLVASASPSYGHLALAALMKLDKARLVWTTNFDRMVEDAAVEVLGGSSRFVIATLDSAQVAMEAINEGRWPLLVKLHGDFQSRQLKNTSDELKVQDEKMRHALVEACKRYGLAVVGYSGRDHSVMDALEEAIDDGNGYPAGLFWFQRSDSPALPRVTDLISKANAQKIQANIINVETFDELLSDVLLLIQNLPDELTEILNRHAPRITNAPIPETKGRWPVVRLNALPVVSYPTLCRKVVCEIGGMKEVNDAVTNSGADVIATRRQVGVLAFGRDAEVRKAFDSCNITEFDVHTIEVRRLRYESAELGLMYDAMYRAIDRERPVKLERVGHHYLVAVEASRSNEAIFTPLRQATKVLTGKVPTTQLQWAEAIWIKLEYRLDRLWLLIEPTIWVERIEDDALFSQTREFIRERLAGRYNPKWNELIEAWAHIITNGEQESEIRAFGIGDGVDAAFSISAITAFSWREGGR